MAWTALSVYIASTMIIGGLIVIRPGFWMMDPMCRFPAAPQWSDFIKNYRRAGWDNLTDEEVEKNHGIQLQLGKSFGRHGYFRFCYL